MTPERHQRLQDRTLPRSTDAHRMSASARQPRPPMCPRPRPHRLKASTAAKQACSSTCATPWQHFVSLDLCSSSDCQDISRNLSAKRRSRTQGGHAHAGSTPFFSRGRRPGLDLGDDNSDVPVGSPSTVARKLLQPVLLDTIQALRTRSAPGPGRLLPLGASTPGQAQAPGAGEMGPRRSSGAQSQEPALTLTGAAASGRRGMECQAEGKASTAKEDMDLGAGHWAAEETAASESEASEQGAIQEQGR